jgi:uncharacterized protein YcfL
MDFNNFISKLFYYYQQAQKLESPLNNPFYYDEFGTIKEFEKLRDMAMEQIKNLEEQKALVAAIHLKKGETTEEQSRINILETQVAELHYRIAWQDYHSINQHIQVSKTIVALSKILRPIVTALPDPKTRKQMMKLFEYLPILTSIDEKLNKFADIQNENKKEQK